MMRQTSLLEWIDEHLAPAPAPAPPPRLAGTVLKTRGTEPPPPPPVAKRAAS